MDRGKEKKGKEKYGKEKKGKGNYGKEMQGKTQKLPVVRCSKTSEASSDELGKVSKSTDDILKLSGAEEAEEQREQELREYDAEKEAEIQKTQEMAAIIEAETQLLRREKEKFESEMEENKKAARHFEENLKYMTGQK